MSKGERCLTTAGFYGKKNKRKCIGLENSINCVLKKHQNEKIPKSFPSRILGPITTWQTFYRQQEAFQFCKTTSKDLHVFAFESECFEGNTGQRLYLTASYPVFWHYYSQLDEHKRLHYEVIPEGAVCKLYFDLEYDKIMNPESDGNSMVNIFIEYVCLTLQSTFNLTCTKKGILDFDASTEKKFSRHLIFQMKNAAFKDNIHAGRFVCCIMSRLLKKIHLSDTSDISDMSDSTGTYIHADNKSGNTEDLEELEASRDTLQENDQTALNLNNCDNVSLSNLGSMISPATKHETDHDQTGKDENMEKDNKNNDAGDKLGPRNKTDNFEEILASFNLEDLQKFVVRNKNGDNTLFCDTGVYTKNRNFRLFLSSKLGKKNPLMVAKQNEFCSQGLTEKSKLENIFYDSLVANVKYCGGMRILTFDEGNTSGLMAGLPGKKKEKTPQETECIDGYNKSPYPEVDEYIRSIIAGDAGKGVIRHWTYFHQGELLVYEIAKYRYCHNIGRHHRSNNIMLIADLHKGIWYQKCHDPDCHTQNYKSPEWLLPRDLLPASYFDDDLDLEMDDDELLNTTEELEKQYMEQQAPSSGISEFDDGADDDLIAAVIDLHGSTELENG